MCHVNSISWSGLAAMQAKQYEQDNARHTSVTMAMTMNAGRPVQSDGFDEKSCCKSGIVGIEIIYPNVH